MFLQVRWPNQQCQSTEGGWLVIQIALNLTRLISPCYNNTTCIWGLATYPYFSIVQPLQHIMKVAFETSSLTGTSSRKICYLIKGSWSSDSSNRSGNSTESGNFNRMENTNAIQKTQVTQEISTPFLSKHAQHVQNIVFTPSFVMPAYNTWKLRCLQNNSKYSG